MSLISKVSSCMPCCFRVHQSDEDEFPTNPNTSHAQSPISVKLSPSTVPHASSKCKNGPTDDDEALRGIFRSTSSVRGYQTASEQMQLPAPERPSFDVDFKFGVQDSDKKPPGRLGRLSNHIKQRLSEGRLSKTNSVDRDTSEDIGQSPPLGLNTEALMIPKSNGLLELIISRTGSERGYDSDAKSIQTMLLKASDPFTKSSPLATKEFASVVDDALSLTASPIRFKDDSDQFKIHTQKSSNDHVSHTLAARTSFTEALLAEKDSSPTAALQRLSTCISNGTIKLPSSHNSTGGLKNDAGREKILTNPADLSSAETMYNTKEKVEILSTLNKLGNTVLAAQRDSLASMPESDLRASIVSSLDPTFINFISRFAEPDNSKQIQDSSNPSYDPGSTIVGENIFSSTSNISRLDKKRESHNTERDLNPWQGSDQASVHLYNMRISQNLACPSLAAYTSRPTTSQTTISNSKRPSMNVGVFTKRQSSDSYVSRRVTTEHNRRPSDPQTRRLFEPSDTADKLRSQWKTVTSYNSGISDPNLRPVRSGDDGSSFYWSDNELKSGTSSLRVPPRRNPNSFAIGGRSESISFPVGFSTKSIDMVSEVGGDRGVGRNDSHNRRNDSRRSRSSSMPVNIRPQHLHPENRNRYLNYTSDNEKLSEISIGVLEDARRENLTEISVQAIHDARDETMSEIDHTKILEKCDQRLSLHVPVASDRRRSRSESKDLRTHWQTRRRSTSGATQSLGPPTLLESTTDMWQRTFRQAVAEPHDETMGGFFSTPRYDRDGTRCKSKGSSVSNMDRDAVDPMTNGPHDDPEHPRLTFDLEKELDVEQGRSPILPTLMENNNIRKKSLLDLGRRFAGTATKDSSETRSENLTPLRDILGL
ncbi:hypothetical protein LTR84_001540 [Exophiala bonariae]|uniref:Uncharacterized protein n=1 Tax=Exophiala bonariae TaxID=1690606 RepID=A0AAV9NGB0_9EURO|nr:hypothetical protein LTR84_001540 [Exophiala bonariae]